MATVLDFNTIKKRYMTVVFADPDKTTIRISTPTKELLSELETLETLLKDVDPSKSDPAVMDDLYTACAKIMTRNRDGVKITKKYLEKVFDLDDVFIFFQTYVDFVTELANQKN